MNHVYLFVIVNNVIHIVMKSGKCLLMLLMILFSPMAFAQQSGVKPDLSLSKVVIPPSSKQRYDC